MEDPTPPKKKKQSIPKVLKDLCWNKWIGDSIAKHVCLCCEINEIKMNSFHCGHILAESNGGITSVENMKPICAACNLSMGQTNMEEFKQRCGFGRHIVPKAVKVAKAGKAEKAVKADKPKIEKIEKTEKTEKTEKAVKAVKTVKADKADKPKAVKVDKTDKPKAVKALKAEKAVKADKPKTDKTDKPKVKKTKLQKENDLKSRIAKLLIDRILS